MILQLTELLQRQDGTGFVLVRDEYHFGIKIDPGQGIITLIAKATTPKRFDSHPFEKTPERYKGIVVEYPTSLPDDVSVDMLARLHRSQENYFQHLVEESETSWRQLSGLRKTEKNIEKMLDFVPEEYHTKFLRTIKFFYSAWDIMKFKKPCTQIACDIKNDLIISDIYALIQGAALHSHDLFEYKLHTEGEILTDPEFSLLESSADYANKIANKAAVLSIIHRSLAATNERILGMLNR